MNVSLKPITEPEALRSACLIAPVFSDGKLPKSTARLDKHCGGLVRKLLKRGDISGKLAQSLLLPGADNIKADRLLLIGCGEQGKLSQANFRKVLKALLSTLDKLTIKDACLLFNDIGVEGRNTAWQAEQLAILGGTQTYRYTKTVSKPKPASTLKQLTLDCKPSAAIRTAVAQGKAIALGMNTARELGNLPGNICTPSFLASEAKALARKHQTLSVSVLEEKKMRELGMGSLLSVTAGSDQAAKLIVMEYRGAAKSQQPHALVGKGITFDTGGISLKPGATMDEMKFDMCGAASVLGTVTAVATLKLPINLVAVIAAAENMPGGGATKPGDVVKSMSGQTIEVLNTDAEGRLVLCDALTYTEKFKPQSVIDIATLTGACIVALGHQASGLFSNQDDFAKELLAAGEEVGDRAWQLPMWDEYQPQLDSNFADIANIGSPGGGSITAACFLSRFTKNMRWAHLDIAGTAWLSGADKGATGRPVGLLTRYLINKSGK